MGLQVKFIDCAVKVCERVKEGRTAFIKTLKASSSDRCVFFVHC